MSRAVLNQTVPVDRFRRQEPVREIPEIKDVAGERAGQKLTGWRFNLVGDHLRPAWRDDHPADGQASIQPRAH